MEREEFNRLLADVPVFLPDAEERAVRIPINQSDQPNKAEDEYDGVTRVHGEASGDALADLTRAYEQAWDPEYGKPSAGILLLRDDDGNYMWMGTNLTYAQQVFYAQALIQAIFR